ncbi:MAG: SprT family zinc-dependent metalloprotease [Clostridia bacterium]
MKLEYELIRKNIKNVYIKIMPNEKIRITAPINMSIDSIENIIEKKSKWIYNTLEKLKHKDKKIIHKYIDGELFYYLGNKYYLKIIENQIGNKIENKITNEIENQIGNKIENKIENEIENKIENEIENEIENKFKNTEKFAAKNLQKNKINIKSNVSIIENNIVVFLGEGFSYNTEFVKKSLLQFYKTQSTTIFNILLKQNTEKFKYFFNGEYTLKIRDMKSRWGSCFSTKNTITLNRKLIYVPQKYIEYVIIHELTHFIYIYHDKNFYKLLSQLLPNWKILKKELNAFSNIFI